MPVDNADNEPAGAVPGAKTSPGASGMRSCRDEASTSRVRPRAAFAAVLLLLAALVCLATPGPAWAQPGVTVSESALTVPEGSSATYTIVLKTRPSAAVYVTVARNASGDADITATPFSLVFTAANWNVTQEVTVAAAADPDGIDGTATISHDVFSFGDSNYSGIAVAGVAVTEDDSETPAVLVNGMSAGEVEVAVPEGGSTTYSLVLATRPLHQVSIALSTFGDTDVTASPLTLVFDVLNWDVPQNVTLAAAHDVDFLPGPGLVRHAATSSDPDYHGTTIPEVEFEEADDDMAGLTLSTTFLRVPEEGTGEVTVVMDTIPEERVTVTIAPNLSDAARFFSFTPSSLTFTRANWHVPQTVTFTSLDDDQHDVEGLTYFVRVTAGEPEYRALDAIRLVVLTIDTDLPELVFSTTEVSVREGASATWTVRPDRAPVQPFAVAVTRLGDADLDAQPGELYFTAENWRHPQPVRVWAAQDEDVVNGRASFQHVILDDDDREVRSEVVDVTGILAGTVVVTEVDDEFTGARFLPEDLTVAEGGSGTYRVVLGAPPTHAVTLTLERSGDADLSASPDTLVFTPADWDVPQTVTVSAAPDPDGADGAAHFRHTAASDDDAYDGLQAGRVTVLEADNAAVGVTVTPADLDVREGASASYTMALDYPPAADVTVRVVRAGDADLTASPAVLVFTPDDWSAPKTVTVSAAHDDDGAGGTARFLHVAQSGDPLYDDFAVDRVDARELDDDDAGVTVSRTDLTVREGASETYTLVLDVAPAEAVRITVARQAGGDGSLTASPATLDFTTANWNVPQTVTISAAQDGDTTDGTAVFTHSAASSDSDYQGLAIDAVTAAERDDDRRPGLVFTGLAGAGPGTLQYVAEGGASTNHIVLTDRPSADVTVGLSLGRVRQGVIPAVSPASIVFTPQDWNVPRSVTVSTTNDDEDDATGEFSVFYQLTSADPGYHNLEYTLRFLEADNGRDIRVTVSPTTLVVPEGSTATYTIALTDNLLDDAFLTVTRASGDANLTASASAGQFGAVETSVVVTVSAAPDADSVDGSATFVHTLRSADPGGDGLVVPPVTVVEVDRGVTGTGVAVLPGSLAVDEGGSATYEVALNTRPAANVTVAVSRNAAGDADLAASPASLVFTPANWSTPQEVTVSAQADGDSANGRAVFLHAVSSTDGAYNGIVAPSVTVTERDASGLAMPPAPEFVQTTTVVAEGSSTFYAVRLDRPPVVDMTLVIVPSEDGVVFTEPANLHFNTRNWQLPQAVKLTAVQDDDAFDERVTLMHLWGGEPGQDVYDQQDVAVEFTITDDDTPAIVVSRPSLAVYEGLSETYTVALATEPQGEVLVALSRSGDADLSADPATLVFDPTNWAAPQQVTVSAAEDADETDGHATLTHVTVGGAIDYRGVSPATLAVVETDDDPAAAALSATSLTVVEGATATYTVTLGKRPASEVRVAVTGTGDTSLSASPAELVFGTGNWDTAQAVTVSAAQDDDGADGSTAFGHAVTSADPDYNGLALETVAVTETDDDAVGVSVSAASLVVTERDLKTYTVALDTEPAAPVDIAVSVSGDPDVTVQVLAPAPQPTPTLTFTAQNWNEPQRVLVFAGDDADAAAGTAVVSHSAESSDAQYHGIDIAAVQVSELDDDTPALVLAPVPLRVPEGGSASYGVSLATRPLAPVEVQIAAAPGGVSVSPVPSRLDFTVDDWDQPQQVTVSSDRERDDADGSATLGHSVTSADPGYDLQVSLAVEVVDAEGQPGLAVSSTDLAVAEDGEATFTVALRAEPAGDVTVAVRRTAGDTDLVRTSPEELLFTPQNWAVAQTVVFEARADADSANGTAAWRVAVLAATKDAALQGLQVDVAVAEIDNDTAWVGVSKGGLSLGEGDSGSWTIVLGSAPLSHVDIFIERAAGGDAGLNVTVPEGGWRFTADNWNQTQTVVVVADDDPDHVDGTASFVHRAVSEDASYNGISIPQVTVNVSDPDVPEVVVSHTSLDVTEGESGSWTVELDAQPLADVTVTVSRESGDEALTAAPAVLTFTPDNYDTAQTVTVTAAEDELEIVDGVATFTHTAASDDAGYDGIAIDAVTVTKLDNDRQGYVVLTRPSGTAVDEGGSLTWGFALNAPPRAAVKISMTRQSGDVDLVAAPVDLTFDATNWNVVQSITVTAAQDDDAVDGTATFLLGAESDDILYDAPVAAELVLTENDDDTPGVGLSETSLTAPEGGAASWDVVLLTKPSDPVTVTLTRADDGDADLSATPGALVFKVADWNVAQTVTVQAAQDDDAHDGATTFGHSATSDDGDYSGDAIDAVEVRVTEADDDTPGVVLSTQTLVVHEDSQAAYTVALATRPAQTVTVAIEAAGSNAAGLTINPGSLEFTPEKWNEAQEVTVTAPDDADALDAAESLTHVAASVDNGYGALEAPPLPVTVVDDDVGGLSVTRSSVDVEEGGETSWLVTLRSQPAEEVRVSIARTAGGDEDLTVSPAALVFTPASWDTAHEVTVSAPQDADAVDGVAVFEHSTDSADPLFAGTKTSVEATEVDDDTVGMTLSLAEVAVPEGGSSGYTVVLDAAPAADVTVTVQAAAGGDPDLTHDPAELVFTSEDWDLPKTVTISAAADTDGLNGEAVFVHTVASADATFAALAEARVAAREVDGNPPGVVLSGAAVAVPEGATASYTVVLRSEPADEVIIEVSRAAGGDADLTARPRALVFSAADWNAPQTVSLAAADDADGDNGTALFLHAVQSADPAYEGIDSDSVEAAEADDDVIAVVVSPPRLPVSEGLSADWAVVLGTRPSADVAVTLAPQPGGDPDLTASPTELVFTSVNWNTAQTVTVAAAEDADETDGVAGFSFTAASDDSGYGGIEATVAQAVEEDDDPAGVTLSAPTLSVPEDSSATYTLALDSRPSAPVAIALVVSGDADLTVTPLDLMFTPDNWSTAQTATVAAAADDDADDGAAVVRHEAISADPDYHLLAIAGLDAAEADDDDPGVTIAPLALTVLEGSTAAYTVVLASRPTDNVTVRVAHAGDADLSADVDLLVFTSANWNAAQTVTVTAAEDDDDANGAARFIHTVTSDDTGYDGLTVDRVVATEDDPDVPGVSVAPVSLAVREGGSATYTVVLDLAPAADVTISVTRSGDTDLSADLQQLVFTPANWKTPQAVTVSAALDVDGFAGTARFAHAASSSDNDYQGITIDTVVAAEVDLDAAGVTVSRTDLTVTEGGSETYTLVLNRAPAAHVAIAVAAQAGGDGDLTASPARLDFTTANWAVPQTVTIAAAQDADDTDGTAVFTHTATSNDSDYDGLAIAAVAAAESDDDRGPGLVFTGLIGDGPGKQQYVPEGEGRTYQIVLTTRPSADVTVGFSLTGVHSSAVTPAVSPGAIVFTPQNWNVPQTVTVSTAEDDDVAAGTFRLIHNLTSADSGYQGLGYSLFFVQTDNDRDIRVTVTPTTLTVPEGSSATYTISLTGDGAVENAFLTVTRASGDEDLTASPDRESFGAVFTEVTVTVSAAADADAVEGSATFVHTLRSDDPALDGYAVEAVVVVEDEDRGGVRFSTTSVSVEEGGSTGYRLALDNRPTADVTIAVARAAGGDADLGASPAALVFTPDNWNVEQTLTIAAAADDDAVDGTATFTHTVSSDDDTYHGIMVASVVATETDTGEAAVTVSESAISVTEGSEAGYDVVLTSEPVADVTVAVTLTPSNDGGADLSASPAELVFTSANWSAPQTVTVSAAADDNAVNGAATVTHAVSGGDYGGVTADPVEVTEVDIDTAGITPSIDETARLEVNEGGTAAYTVVLDSRPTADVTIAVARDPEEADLAADLTELVFAPAQWDVPQTVTVSAALDADGTDDEVSLVHTSTSDDMDYAGLSFTVAAVAIDANPPGVTVTESRLAVAEGATAFYELSLDSEPTADVTISVQAAAGGDPDITTLPQELIFTSVNWKTRQRVVVTAAEDDDGIAGSATLTHAAASADGDYDGITIDAVVVSEIEKDEPRVNFTPTRLRVIEGSEAAWSVALNTQPSAEVRIELELVAGGDADLALLDTALVFTSDNWDTPQMARVSAAEDDDDGIGSATVRYRSVSSDTGYSGLTDDLTAVEADNEAPGAVFSAANLEVPEGGSASYTITLTKAPTAPVFVDITRNTALTSDADLTAVPATVEFAVANWSEPRTVRIEAAEDDDAVSTGGFLFAHTVTAGSDADYAGRSLGAVNAAEKDNDRPGVSLSRTGASVPEEKSAGWTVRLDTRPTEDVTITVQRASGDQDLQLSGGAAQLTLTFTPANWNQPQQVVVEAAKDDDALQGRAVFSHTASSRNPRNEQRPGDTDYDGIEVASVEAVEKDNDTPGVSIVAAAAVEGRLKVNEEAGQGSWTVRLDTRPAADVTISIVGRSDGFASFTINPVELVFTSENWDTPQTVTVSAEADDDNAVRGETEFLHSAASEDPGYDGISIETVIALEIDNDVAGITVSVDKLDVPEGGTASYTVVLDTRPARVVTVMVTPAELGDADLTADKTELVFTSENWDTPQTVVVSARDDPDVVHGTRDFAHTVRSDDAGYHNFQVAAVEVKEADNDTYGITLSAASLSVEEGAEVTYTVVLNVPVGIGNEVSIAAAEESGAGKLVLSGPPLVFDDTNWNVPQAIAVQGAEDDDGLDESAAIVHTLTSDDLFYAELETPEFPADHRVTVDVTDDDPHGITVSTDQLTVNEGGQAEYTLVLDTQPSSSVQVALRLVPVYDASLSVSPATMAFAPDSWDTPQTVTVTAAHDGDAAGGSGSVAHTVSSSDGLYDAFAADTVAVTLVDDDTIGVTVSPPRLEVREGSSGQWDVVLNTRPAANVVISLERQAGGDADLAASPTALTFLATNWNVAQTVTVTASEDDDGVDGSVAFTVSTASTDSDYDSSGGLGTFEVEAVEDDNDTIGILRSHDSLSVPEGGTASYTVALGAAPAADVRIDVSREATGDADLSASPARLDFTPTNWNLPQRVTVQAQADTDAVHGSAVFLHTATSGDQDFDGLSVTVEATESDDDAKRLVLSDVKLPVLEGSSGTYTVALDAAPASNVTVRVTRSGGNAQLTIVPARLEFTPDNWQVPQTVTVSVTDNAVRGQAFAEVRNRATGTGSGFHNISADIEIDVVDDEARHVFVSRNAFSVAEGGSVAYTVGLSPGAHVRSDGDDGAPARRGS